MRQINRASKVPLYHQLYNFIREDILKGVLKPGDRIPPESDLIAEYQVSRTTIRQVLDRLAQEGLILRQAGRGTFVTHPTVEQGLARIVSFTEDMHLRGMDPRSQVLFSGIIPAPPRIAEKLQVPSEEPLARLDRLRLANGEPMSVERSHLVHRFCPGVLEGDYQNTSLREALTERYGITLVRAKQSMQAAPASPDLAATLAVESGSPILSIERISFSQDGIPVEYISIEYRGDRYTLHTELQG